MEYPTRRKPPNGLTNNAFQDTDIELVANNNQPKDQSMKHLYEVILYADNTPVRPVKYAVRILGSTKHSNLTDTLQPTESKLNCLTIVSDESLGRLGKIEIHQNSYIEWFVEKISVYDEGSGEQYEFGPGTWIGDGTYRADFDVMHVKNIVTCTPGDEDEMSKQKRIHIVNNQILLDCVLSQNENELKWNLSKRRGTDLNISLYGTRDKLLHAAVCTGSKGVIEQLLSYQGVNVNVKGTRDLTPLHVACALRHQEDVVSMLIDSGADIEARAEEGLTPLALSVQRGVLTTAKMLMEMGADWMTRDTENQTLLHHAVQHPDMLRMLLDRLEVKEELLNTYDRFGRTPLHISASSSLTVLQMMLDSGADKAARDSYGWNAVHFSADSGNLPCLRELLDSGVSVDVEDDFKNRAFHIASQKAHFNIIQELMDRKASLSQNIKGESPLHLATTSGSSDIVEAIINAFPSALDVIDCDGNTALNIAARHGHEKLVKYLLDKSCKVWNNWHKENVLDIALKHGHDNVVGTLASRKDWHRYLRKPDEDEGHAQLADVFEDFPEAGLKFLDQFVTEEEVYHADILDNPLTKLFDHARKNGLRIRTIFERLDTDKTGSISRDEIKQGMLMMGTEFTDAEVDHVINVFDKNGDGEINLRELYEKLPQKSGSSNYGDKKKKKTYNFRYLKGEGVSNPLRRLMTAVTVDNETNVKLMRHPVIEKLIAISWRSVGYYVYLLNISVFLLFLCLLTSLVVLEADYEGGLIAANTLPPCNNSNITADCSSFVNDRSTHIGIAVALIVTVSVLILKEIYQMIIQDLFSYVEIDNAIEWTLYISTLVFACGTVTGYHNRMPPGAIAIFLGWLDFVLYLQLLPLLGIYVNMIKILMGTLIKVMWILVIFIIAFALAFYAIKSTSVLFDNVGLSFVSTVLQTFGELNYKLTFIDNQQHYSFALVLYVIFCFMVLITLNNLLIGLAVGDVDTVRRIARIKQQLLEIELYLHLNKSWLGKLLGKRVNFDEYTEDNYKHRSTRRAVIRWVQRILEIGLHKDAKEDRESKRRFKQLQSLNEQLEKLDIKIDSMSRQLAALHDNARRQSISENGSKRHSIVELPTLIPTPSSVQSALDKQCGILSGEKGRKGNPEQGHPPRQLTVPVLKYPVKSLDKSMKTGGRSQDIHLNVKSTNAGDQDGSMTRELDSIYLGMIATDQAEHGSFV